MVEWILTLMGLVVSLLFGFALGYKYHKEKIKRR